PVRREPPSAGGAVPRGRGNRAPRRGGGPAGQGDVVQQLARRGVRGGAGPDAPRAGGSRGEAQQPVRSGGRGDAGGGLPGGRRLRPGFGVRRRGGVQRERRRGHRGRDRGRVHRGGGGAGVRRRGADDVLRESQSPRGPGGGGRRRAVR